MGDSLGRESDKARKSGEKPYLFIDQRFTSPSPPPLTRLTKSGFWAKLACGCQARPPTRSLWPLESYDVDDSKADENIPRNERTSVQAGTFHNLTVPDQLPVASISLLGANRTCDIGRSSPIWEPRFANFYVKMLQPSTVRTSIQSIPSLQQRPFS